MKAEALEVGGAAARAATKSGRLEAFDHVVGSGVSGNLCSALARLHGATEGSFRVSVLPSPRQPEDGGDSDALQVERYLHTEYQGIYKAAAEHLRTPAQPDVERIVGPVRALKREPGSLEGEVIVTANVNRRPRQVRVYMPAHHYNTAIRAHRQGRRLMIDGFLASRSRGLVMESPINVEIT